MERRNFVKGLLLGLATPTDALVRLASPAEASALTVAKPVLVGQPEAMSAARLDDLGTVVYINRGPGQYLPIGVITRTEYLREMEDDTRMGDAVQSWRPAPTGMRITVQVQGYFRG